MQLGREQKAAISCTHLSWSFHEGRCQWSIWQSYSLPPHQNLARNDTELMYQDLLHVNTASHFIAIKLVMSTASDW